MLVLTRKKDEKIIIGDNITVMVIEIQGEKVRIGIDAPKEITVHRQEVYDAIQREKAAADPPPKLGGEPQPDGIIEPVDEEPDGLVTD